MNYAGNRNVVSTAQQLGEADPDQQSQPDLEPTAPASLFMDVDPSFVYDAAVNPLVGQNHESLDGQVGGTNHLQQQHGMTPVGAMPGHHGSQVKPLGQTPSALPISSAGYSAAFQDVTSPPIHVPFADSLPSYPYQDLGSLLPESLQNQPLEAQYKTLFGGSSTLAPALSAPVSTNYPQNPFKMTPFPQQPNPASSFDQFKANERSLGPQGEQEQNAYKPSTFDRNFKTYQQIQAHSHETLQRPAIFAPQTSFTSFQNIDTGPHALYPSQYPPQNPGHSPSWPIPGTTIDPSGAFLVQGYLSSPNRYSFGERKLVIHSPRVGQKSYGNEKRFLCPPPVATLYGRAWWSKTSSGARTAPSINISIAGEAPANDAHPNWTTSHNRLIEEPREEVFTNGEQPFIGKACGKSLHISDAIDKKTKSTMQSRSSVQAITTVMIDGPSMDKSVVGAFESKPIQIVSKPSKKRHTTRNSDLFLHHGTQISIYNRVRSQTNSTKFLAVSADILHHVGSDGKPIPTDPTYQRFTPHFVAESTTWDPLSIWLVDPILRASAQKLEGQAQPPDVITLTPEQQTSPILLHYNLIVRLQCPATGLTTPMLVIRKVDNGTTAYGGDGSEIENHPGKCPAGEVPGEPISQLHRVAFELYAPENAPYLPVYGKDFKYPGQWLNVDKKDVEYQLGKTPRTLVAGAQTTPQPRSRTGSSSSLSSSSPNLHRNTLLPMTPREFGGSPTGTNLPLQSGQDYFSQAVRQNSFTHAMGSHSGASPPYGVAASPSWETMAETNGPGPIRMNRTSSGASLTNKNGLGLGLHIKSAATSPPSNTAKLLRRGSGDVDQAAAGERNKWSVEIPETAAWTIVGAETQTYTFWIAPGSSLQEPVTPLPTIQRCLPPGQRTQGDQRHTSHITTLSTLPQATFYGSGFTKDQHGNPKFTVWWGAQPAEENEFRCAEVFAAAVPRPPLTRPPGGDVRYPISLVRSDGSVVVPTGLTWRERAAPVAAFPTPF